MVRADRRGRFPQFDEVRIHAAASGLACRRARMHAARIQRNGQALELRPARLRSPRTRRTIVHVVHGSPVSSATSCAARATEAEPGRS